MKNVFTLLAVLILMSCDDGDIVVTDLDFEDQTLERCDNFDYVFYKINPESNESIAFQFATNEEILGNPGEVTIELDGDNTIVYRRFDDVVTSDYFCNPIPPTTPLVTEELISDAGMVTITTAGDLEDDDGIPSDIEDPTGLVDTDMDGLLDIYDEDDDGDNIPTDLEGVAFNDDGTIDIVASRDTDGDGTLDYLDTDDDNDGVLTINEDADEDLDPRNDDANADGIADYLDPNSATFTLIDEFRLHSYSLINVEVTIIVNNIQFIDENGEAVINFVNDIINFGTYDAPDFPLIETPDFN